MLKVAFLRGQLANLDAQRAAVEARLAAVLEPGSESDPIVPPTAAARKRIAQRKDPRSFGGSLPAARRLCTAMKHAKRRSLWLRASLFKRMGRWSLRKTENQVRRMPEPSLTHPNIPSS